MTMLKKILQESKDKKKVIGIRMYGDDENFWCGYITNFNDYLVLIQHFTDYGQADGIVIEKIENIESIDNNDNYSSSFQYLIENQNNLDQKQYYSDLPNFENWQYDLLKRFNKVDQIVSLEFDEDIVIFGNIKDLDYEYIKLQTIGNLGDIESISTYRITDIASIRIDSEESIKRKILLEWKLKKINNIF